MTRRPLPGADSAAWVLLGTAVSGLSTYLLLIVVARALGKTLYAPFSVYWTFVVVASIGAFLPVEQLTARGVARHAGDVRPALSSGLRAAAVLGALVLAGGALLAQVAGAVPTDLPTRLAAVGLVAGLVGQFAGRGVLAGVRDLRGYALVLGIDTVLRLLLAIVLWAAGVRTVAPYAAAVALSCLACATAALVLARRARPAPTAPVGAVPALSAAHLLPLVVAGMSMQLLLNSAVLATSSDRSSALALTGLVLAVTTLVRLPVFVFQGAQAGYVARVAGLALTGPADQLRRVLSVVGAAVLAVGGLTVAGSALLGPWAVRVFGDDFDAPRRLVVLAAVGVAAYLVASVLNDLAVALGAGRAIAVAWPLAVVAAVVAHLVTRSDVVLAATLPLAVGSAGAALVLAPAVAARVRHALTSAAPPVPTPREHPGA